MSRAFVKEQSGESATQSVLARPVSIHENLVTARGLHLIANAITQLEQDRVVAHEAEDELSLARIERDLRYWQQRKATARLITPDTLPTKIRFGVTATLSDEGGSERTYTLVGEDEANPAQGFISWLSPVAQTLLGHEVGDVVNVQGSAVEVISLSS